MCKNNLYFGGEFWYSCNIFQFKKNSIFKNNPVLTYGGRHSLLLILEHLKKQNINNILIPYYLCDSVKELVEQSHLQVFYYEINNDFSLNEQVINECISKYNIKTLFVVDYFGINKIKKQNLFLKKLREKKIKVILDGCQTLKNTYDKDIYDYYFNSFRKFLPINGSILFGLVPCNSIKSYYCMTGHLIINRLKKTIFIKQGWGNEKKILFNFKQLNKRYNSDIKALPIDFINKKILEHINFEYISIARRKNFKIADSLLNKYGIFSYDEIKNDTNIIPLGYPVKVKNRDKIRKLLIKKNFFIPIHWPLNNKKKFNEKRFIANYELSKEIMTIPIDHRYSSSTVFDVCKIINNLIKQNE